MSRHPFPHHRLNSRLSLKAVRVNPKAKENRKVKATEMKMVKANPKRVKVKAVKAVKVKKMKATVKM